MKHRTRAVLRRGVVTGTSPLVLLFRRSLRAKFIGVILLVQCCLMGLVILVVEHRQRDLILEESRNRAVALASHLAVLSAGHLLTYNFIKLQQMVVQVAAEADVIYAIVQLPNGRVAAYSGRSDLQGELLEDGVSQQAITAESPLVQDVTTPALADQGYDVAIPLFAPDSTRKWGIIRLGFSLAHARREIQKTLQKLLLLNGLVLALSTSVAVWLARCITKPIQQLVRGVNEVVKGNYHHAVTVTSQDEIGHLAQRFTDMQGALRDYITSLAEEKSRLEEAHTLIKATQAQLIQSEKLAAVGQLAAKIAHEVNNPLAIMKTSLALVSRRLSKEDRNKEHLQTIEEEVGRIARIIRHLLDASRPASDIALLQVNEVIQHLMQFVHDDLVARQIESRLALAEALPPIRMSLDQLKQVLLNLITNARDAMPQGGTLRVTTTSEPARGLRISIADTGSGIAPEHLRRVFEPFFTTKKCGEGLGLGLAVCANIITSAGGTIEVTSVPGQGSEFRLFLPPYWPRIDAHQVAASP